MNLRAAASHRHGLSLLAVLLCTGLAGRNVAVAEPAVTILANFEDASVEPTITQTRNVPASDCALRVTAVPARGRGALAVEIGASKPDTSVAVDFIYREALRYDAARKVAVWAWLNEGQMSVALRLRDARGQIYETPPQPVAQSRRWVLLQADISAEALRGPESAGPLQAPFVLTGCRILTPRLGRQTIFLDDLHIVQDAAPHELVLGRFFFGQSEERPRIFEIGERVDTAVLIENQSRQKALDLTVELAWLRPDGNVLRQRTGKMSLPPAGLDFRSRQKTEFSQTLPDPGLYRLIARVRAPGWTTPAVFETTVAATPVASRLSRGQSRLFGLFANLLREPELDRQLELRVARDVGANMLAVEVPWASLEPRAGDFKVAALADILKPLAQDNIAVLLCLTTPPEWVPRDDAARDQALTMLLKRLGERFGRQAERFLLEADVLGTSTVAQQLARLTALRSAIGEQQLALLPPPLDVADTSQAKAIGAYAQQQPTAPLVFRVRGTVERALGALERYRAACDFAWQPQYVWWYETPPLTDLGTSADSQAVLNLYLHALQAGVGSVVWVELRDDDNDPANLGLQRGLVTRDFSPKTTLLGYVTASGEFTGHAYAGPALPARDALDAALLIGGSRQVAILWPRPNRILPAALALRTLREGQLQVTDVTRRPQALLESAAAPLLPLGSDPQFVTLTFPQPDSKPQLVLEPAWLDVPGTVLCSASGTEFTVNVRPPFTVARGYLQLEVAKDAPLKISPAAAALRVEAGEVAAFAIQVTPEKGFAESAGVTVPLRVSLGTGPVTLPIRVLPLGRAPACPGGAEAELGAAIPPSGRRPSAAARFAGCFAADTFQFTATIEDDRITPPRRQATGDRLVVGVALENQDPVLEYAVAIGAQPVTVTPLGASDETVAPPRVTVDGTGKTRSVRIEIPARALGATKLEAGQRVLVAARYEDDDADGFPAMPLNWGAGLDGSHSSAGFRWFELGSQ